LVDGSAKTQGAGDAAQVHVPAYHEGVLRPHVLRLAIRSDLADVQDMWSYLGIVNAFRAGTIVAVLAAAVGWFMVLRR
jgi:hypothetical protein